MSYRTGRHCSLAGSYGTRVNPDRWQGLAIRRLNVSYRCEARQSDIFHAEISPLYEYQFFQRLYIMLVSAGDRQHMYAGVSTYGFTNRLLPPVKSRSLSKHVRGWMYSYRSRKHSIEMAYVSILYDTAARATGIVSAAGHVLNRSWHKHCFAIRKQGRPVLCLHDLQDNTRFHMIARFVLWLGKTASRMAFNFIRGMNSNLS